MADASKEIDSLTYEYNMVTSYLRDMEEIEALPKSERDELNKAADNVVRMQSDRAKIGARKSRMTDEQFEKMAAVEKDADDGSRKLFEAEEYQKKINIRCPDVFQYVSNLSGGNQQKVVLSKWLFAGPEVLILDEPTRGIDVGAKYEIYCLMAQLAKEGKCIILISSEMPELIGMSNRIIVMCNGHITGEVEGEDATQEKIMSFATKFTLSGKENK